MILRRCNIDHVRHEQRIANWWNSTTNVHVVLKASTRVGCPAKYVVTCIGRKSIEHADLDEAMVAFNLAATMISADRYRIYDDD